MDVGYWRARGWWVVRLVLSDFVGVLVVGGDWLGFCCFDVSWLVVRLAVANWFAQVLVCYGLLFRCWLGCVLYG